MTMIFSLLPGWLWALAVAVAVGMIGVQHVSMEALKTDVATAQTETEKTKGILTTRIAAEAQAITAAVQSARVQEQTARKTQDEKIATLRSQNAAATADLAAARERVRSAIYSLAAPRHRGPDMPGLACAASGAIDPGDAEFQRASGELADRILQIAGEADQVARERNTCAELLGSVRE